MRSLRELPVEIVIVELDRLLPANQRRSLVVSEVARVAARHGVVRLIFEDAEPERQRDLGAISAALADDGAAILSYAHVAPSADPVLWIADLVAWAYSRGGKWRDNLPPLTVRKVP
jgi:hypothetical protein